MLDDKDQAHLREVAVSLLLLLTCANVEGIFGAESRPGLLFHLLLHHHLLLLLQQLCLLHQLQQLIGCAGLKEYQVDPHRLLASLNGVLADTGQGGLLRGHRGGEVVLPSLHQVAVVCWTQTLQSSPEKRFNTSSDRFGIEAV